MSSIAAGGGGAAAAALIGVSEIEGKGRALVASQPLRAGEILLRDSPILVYSALPFMIPPPLEQYHHISYCYCANCFRVLPPPSSSTTLLSCPTCPDNQAQNQVLFCSPRCQTTALASSHSPWVCQALTRLRACPSPLLQHDRQVQARYLVAAYNLSVISPPAFRTLLSLQGECLSAAADNDAAIFLHSLISSLSPPPHSSLELTAALLAKDKLNAFGLMEPFAEDRERSVRAYGIYPRASFFNHDCLPNACRFDYVDADHPDADHNTDIIVRAIHDVPQGREICLSYFPVNLKYSDRQRRLREDYGFICECDRCKVEANWSDNDEEEEIMGSNGDLNEAMDEDFDKNTDDYDSGDPAATGDSDFPHAYFFLTYMCNRNNCWGTLAPLPPSSGATPFSGMECNVCGNVKHFDELMGGDVLV
ncbi:hypothetical protein RJ640_011731 [Escallonia rubra]|uniref:SET domain-containing protein n=1 Tax=Escallonia rubra TaxID=112253 RepID=A0AA88U0F8_9ASTE|nr:hypothetical protein RJ640_011731 [Escallonia rubra]